MTAAAHQLFDHGHAPEYTRIGQYRIHPAAELFPYLEGEEFDAFCADVRANGLRTPLVRIWVTAPNGSRVAAVLDGRNRLRACIATGVRPRWQEYEGADPFAYAISVNLHRRHLDESQRAMVAAKIAKLKRGGNQRSRPVHIPTQAEAAALLNVSVRTVRRARRVLASASTETVASIERGSLSVGRAESATQTSAPRPRVLSRVADLERELAILSKRPGWPASLQGGQRIDLALGLIALSKAARSAAEILYAAHTDQGAEA